MADEYKNLDKDKFLHSSRHVELVVTGDKDVMAFYAETIPYNATTGMNIYRDSAMAHTVYQTNAPTTKVQYERLLLWSRLDSSALVSPFRWVPYVDSDNADYLYINPLKEVFAPRVIFDRTSNQLHLWFWTNMNFDYNGVVYDENELYYIGTQGYATAIDYQDGISWSQDHAE
jgi:hypothetical protein